MAEQPAPPEPRNLSADTVLILALQETVADLADTVADVLDKCNDIKELLTEA